MVNANFDQADDNAREVIHRTKRVTRRRFNLEEKVRIVIEGIRGEITVTALCTPEGIASNRAFLMNQICCSSALPMLRGTDSPAMGVGISDL